MLGKAPTGKQKMIFILSEAEQQLLNTVSDAFHKVNKKVVVVLNIGGVIDVNKWRDRADAILLSWQPGMEAGNAIVDVLSGNTNPSGKLATTFPITYDDVPSAKNFPGKEFPDQAITGSFGMKMIPAEVVYEEGIYVGYRYYNTFNVKPAYEFGYGLSYTDFSYGNLQLSASTFNRPITASITVTNSGKIAGKNVVELYISAPAKTMNKPALELKAFAKTDLLQPGASQTLRFTIDADKLASFDTKTSSWVAEKGDYVVKIGASSLDIKQTATFQLEKDITIGKAGKALAPSVQINELTSTGK